MSHRCIFCHAQFANERGLLDHACPGVPQCDFGHGAKAQSYLGRWDCPVCEAETMRRELAAERALDALA
jgi:hypothetical protein